jgi:peptide-methionine (S)-S-oxide reductase
MREIMRKALWSGIIFAMLLVIGCDKQLSSSERTQSESVYNVIRKEIGEKPMDGNSGSSLATFGNGCFWCTEAIFKRLAGVEKVVSGYSGGSLENPTYEQVSTGNTGHAESIQITYDPATLSYVDLLEVFWRTHDPTTKDRQGYDVGPQYRSIIFYHDAEQKRLAESYKTKLDAEEIWNRPIVTEIEPFTKFWPAEAYHQDYYDNNPTKSYCNVVITPKIEKFKKIFKDRLK